VATKSEIRPAIPACRQAGVFTRKDYRDFVLDSIRFCRVEKGLALHSWCLMSNHLHLVVFAKNENLSDILRDFKKFTSKQISRSKYDKPDMKFQIRTFISWPPPA
jgi:putative transposase